MNKKGIVWQQIMMAIIAIVVVVLVIFWFRQSGDKAVEGPSGVLDELSSDVDGDGVKDFFDKCDDGITDSQKNVNVNDKGCTKTQQDARES
ncbi:MAG: hypothetical protein CMH61_01720 [Nanoarchaeota archaeon]|nr:hypothetical protein [Nanoarchaeota archaeon]